jgi:Phosphate-selective porin O and P
MNKLVTTAIALTAVSASAFATDNGWVSLDQEINNLNASLSAQNATGPKVGGYLRVRYMNSGDIPVTDPVSGTDHDLSGFNLDNVRVEVSGDAGSDYSYKVSFDIASGAAELRDAYAKFQIGEQVYGKIGNFKANFMRSSTVADNKTVLLDRTIIGDGHEWNERDLGLEIGFGYDTLTVTVSAQNGSDTDPTTGLSGDELELCAKAAMNLMGGGVGKVEGAYGAGDSMALTAGLAYMEDSNLDNSSLLGFEVELTSGPFSIAGEMVTLDTDNAIDFYLGALTTTDSSPWDVTGSYLFSDMWEGVVRYEDPDDADNSNQMTFGVNYFVSGHDIKWTAEYIALTTDNAIGDVSVIAVGLAVSL